MRPPAPRVFGSGFDKGIEGVGAAVARPILVFARRGRIDHASDVARSRQQELDRTSQMAGQAPHTLRRGDVIFAPRSEERRVGKEWVSMCRTRWAPNH